MPPFTRQDSRVALAIETETSSKGVMKNVMTKKQIKRGLWRPEEDLVLKNYVQTHGEGNWASVSEKSGLMRGGKSCRLRWKNYLRPNIKRGRMSEEEEDLIIRMHKLLGNRWSLIAGRLPGRTDNEVKNYWNTHLSKGNTHPSQKNPRGKRKAIGSSHHHNSNKEHEDAEIFTPNKRPRPIRDPLEPSCSTTSSIAPKHANQGSDGGRKEDTAVTVFSTDHLSWIEDSKRFSYGDKESNSVLTNYATLGIDDDPFMPYFDSFLLFGALDFNADTYYMNPNPY